MFAEEEYTVSPADIGAVAKVRLVSKHTVREAAAAVVASPAPSPAITRESQRRVNPILRRFRMTTAGCAARGRHDLARRLRRARVSAAVATMNDVDAELGERELAAVDADERDAALRDETSAQVAERRRDRHRRRLSPLRVLAEPLVAHGPPADAAHVRIKGRAA
jgi:hypothetical protein